MMRERQFFYFEFSGGETITPIVLNLRSVFGSFFSAVWIICEILFISSVNSSSDK